MNSSDALIHFLSKALKKRWIDRYTGFASKQKTRKKFLNAIYHDLSDRFDRSKVVKSFPDSAWSMKAYIFQPPDEFGEIKKL